MERITWNEVSQVVSEECQRTKDRWLQMGRLPSIEDCAVAIQTARSLDHQLRSKREDVDWNAPRTESERFWQGLSDDYQLAWNGQLHGNAFVEKTSIQLIDGYRRGLSSRQQNRSNRPHRNWAETREGLAAKAALSDKMARYWLNSICSVHF